MKRKKILAVLAAVCLLLATAACSQSGSVSVPSDSSNTASTQKFTAESSTAAPTVAAIDPSLFSGKVTDIFCAGSGKFLVLADKLNLYDACSGKILAAVETDLTDIAVRMFDGGYMVTGNGKDGIETRIFSSDLSSEKDFVFDEMLNGDFVATENCIAITRDGGKLAIAGFDSLYLYYINENKLSVLLSIADNLKNGSTKIELFEQPAFIDGGQTVAFAGKGTGLNSADSQDNFSVYGSVSADGENFRFTRTSSYVVDELLAGNDYLFMTQGFKTNNGTLLAVGTKDFGERRIRFSSKDEGNDGIFVSEHGHYFATAVLKNDLTVRIYDSKTGSVVHTEKIKNPNKTYFIKTPRIAIAEDIKTCVVLTGTKDSGMKTFASTFSFGA